jgi:hypothetical protein
MTNFITYALHEMLLWCPDKGEKDRCMELTGIEEMKNAYVTNILVAKPKGKQALGRTWNRRNCRRLKTRILSVCIQLAQNRGQWRTLFEHDLRVLQRRGIP